MGLGRNCILNREVVGTFEPRLEGDMGSEPLHALRNNLQAERKQP